MKITSDGVAAAGVATKKVFDDDGAAEVRVFPVVLAWLMAPRIVLLVGLPNVCLVPAWFVALYSR